MELQEPSDLRSRVAEGVVDPSGLYDERADRCHDDMAAYVEGQFALQHEVALVLAGVGVRGDHLARRKARLDAREGAAEALVGHLVGYAQGGEVGALVRTDQ